MFLRDYEEYLANARVDRHKGDTRRVAHLLDLIPMPRRNSLMRTRSTGAPVAGQPCKRAAAKLAGITADA